MTSFYTRTGDSGETSFGGTVRIPKADIRMDVLGTVDETQAEIGLGRMFAADTEVRKELKAVEVKLEDMKADLANPDAAPIITDKDVVVIEDAIDGLTETVLPASFSFEVPGSSVAAAQLQVARAVARRCERLMWQASESMQISDAVMAYINRVSDLCLVCSRIEGKN